MNKELYKSIYDRSRLRNRFGKTPTEENEMLYKNSEINVFRFEIKVAKIISTKMQMET